MSSFRPRLRALCSWFFPPLHGCALRLKLFRVFPCLPFPLSSFLFSPPLLSPLCPVFRFPFSAFYLSPALASRAISAFRCQCFRVPSLPRPSTYCLLPPPIACSVSLPPPASRLMPAEFSCHRPATWFRVPGTNCLCDRTLRVRDSPTGTEE